MYPMGLAVYGRKGAGMVKSFVMKLKDVLMMFPGGRYKAMTLSYDDGHVEDERLADIFRRHGLKATFNVCSGLWQDDPEVLPPERWKEVYEGFEVASHSYSHPTLTRCPSSRVVYEVMEDRRFIESVIGRPVRGFAWPNGCCDSSLAALLPSLGLAYARTVADSLSFTLPEDYMMWNPTCHHDNHLMEKAGELVRLENPRRLCLLYVWGHSFEFPKNGNWNLIEDFAAFAGGHEDIWYATNIEIHDYMEALSRLRFSADCSIVENPCSIPVWLQSDGRTVKVEPGSMVSL